MKSIIFIIASLVISTQASAGTALVLWSASELSMIYPAADYAGDTEPLPYDVGICDADFEGCLEFDLNAPYSDSQPNAYKSGNCEITITRKEYEDKSVETVSITKGADSCKVKNGANLESIGQDFIFDYGR